MDLQPYSFPGVGTVTQSGHQEVPDAQHTFQTYLTQNQGQFKELRVIGGGGGRVLKMMNFVFKMMIFALRMHLSSGQRMQRGERKVSCCSPQQPAQGPR